MDKLSLEDEKYLNKLNRLNALDLISLNHSKEIELGLADCNFDYPSIQECEKQLTIIDTVLQARVIKN